MTMYRFTARVRPALEGTSEDPDKLTTLNWSEAAALVLVASSRAAFREARDKLLGPEEHGLEWATRIDRIEQLPEDQQPASADPEQDLIPTGPVTTPLPTVASVQRSGWPAEPGRVTSLEFDAQGWQKWTIETYDEATVTVVLSPTGYDGPNRSQETQS